MVLNILFFKIDKNVQNQIHDFVSSSSSFKINFNSIEDIEELKAINAKQSVDIILLDVSHAKLEVIAILKETNQIFSKLIIFSSTKKDIFEFVSYNIFDFLLIPTELSILLTCVNRCINKIFLEFSLYERKFAQEKFQKFVPISSTKKIELIKIDDIVYFEADGRYTKLYLTNGISKMASKNLGEFQNLLDPRFFCRIHHKFIINMNKLVNIAKSDGYYCEMINNKNIPVSKRKFENLNAVLNIGKNGI
jgi:two-component system LytT family response regulator